MDTQNAQAPRKKRKLRKRLTILLIIALLIIGAFYVFSKLNQPTSAAVKTSQGQAVATDYNIDLTPTAANGSVASFNYPKGLRLVSTALSGPPSVEDFNFYFKDIGSWI